MIRRNVSRHPKLGAEVGVFRGENAASVSLAFPGLKMILVDTWKEWPKDSSYYKSHKDCKSENDKMGTLSETEWDLIMSEATERFFELPHEIRRMSSEDAAKLQENGSLDFVFLDANHMYPEVKKDINIWIDKVRLGGLICGHDYRGAGERRYGWGVSKAVNEVFGEENILIRPGHLWGYKKI